MISLRIRGEDQLAEVARRLRRGDQVLRGELLEGLRTAARPAVADIKRAISTADVSGRRTRSRRRFTARIVAPPLRARIARAVESDISTGGGDPRVTIRLREGSIPVRARLVVKYIVGSASRWRHPIMGRRSTWVSQNAPNVWWKTLQPHLPRFRAQVDRAVSDTARQLEG